MSKKKPTNEDMLEAMVHMMLAHNASMVALVKALEESGAVTAEGYEHMLRLSSASLAAKGQISAAGLVDDLADMMREEKTRQ